jgi:hypothetical protein
LVDALAEDDTATLLGPNYDTLRTLAWESQSSSARRLVELQISVDTCEIRVDTQGNALFRSDFTFGHAQDNTLWFINVTNILPDSLDQLVEVQVVDAIQLVSIASYAFKLSQFVGSTALKELRSVSVAALPASSGAPWIRVSGSWEARIVEVAHIALATTGATLLLSKDQFSSSNSTDPYQPKGPFYFDSMNYMVLDTCNENPMSLGGNLVFQNARTGETVDVGVKGNDQWASAGFEEECGGFYANQINLKTSYPILRM